MYVFRLSSILVGIGWELNKKECQCHSERSVCYGTLAICSFPHKIKKGK